MKMLVRCNNCRLIVDSNDPKKTEEKAVCCDNPRYVKIKPIHFMHKDAPGEIYSSSHRLGPVLQKLAEIEGIPSTSYRLACKERARQAGVAAVSLPQAVTCPDCLEWIKQNNLPEVDISVPPEMPSNLGDT